MALLVNGARIVFAPLVGEFIDAFGVGEATVGVVTTLVWVGSAAPRIPTGWLLTRVPRHRVVLGTGVLLVAASALAATADSVPTLAVGATAMGLASGVYFVAANPLVSELFPDRVGRAMGVHGVASQVASVLAAPFVTLVLVVAGLPWRAVLLAVGAGALVVTLALYVTARRTDLPDAGAADRDLPAAARAQWRVLLVGVAVLGLAGFVWQGLFNFFELYLRSKGVPPTTARNGLTLLFAAGVPAFLLSGRLADRLPHLPYLIGVMGAFVASVLALTLAEGLLALAAATVVVGYALHSLFPATDAYLLEALPDRHRASAYAVYSFGMVAVQAPGSSILGSLVEAGYGYDAVLTVASVGLGGVALLLAGLYRAGRLPGADVTPASAD
jgi:predicted MFS family arabinose efflux permease